MKTKILETFKRFAIEPKKLASLKGGLCMCKQAAPYACETGGYTVGTVEFRQCMVDVYAGCNAYDASCHQQ